MKATVSIMLLSLLATRVSAGTGHVWIIGGGYDLESSQAQIEQNVLWARQVIRRAGSDKRLHIQFTDGSDPGKDVKEWQPPAEGSASLQPLARLYNTYIANGETYRNHRIPDIESGTEAGVLRKRLQAGFRNLEPGDRALIIFNGHGSIDRGDPAGNRIWLWNRTQMDVRDMDGLLTHIHPDVPVRFVFTQCYSGGFARLIRPGARDVPVLGRHLRCGFMAEAADRRAEGCAAGIDIGDYRDYSTYFFAALNGRTRNGKELPYDPDHNGDGQVSLYEAHLYTLRAAHSSDLPRSTSEEFLRSWQPWYLRWFGGRVLRDNRYHRLARQVADDIGLQAGNDSMRQAIARRQRARLGEYQRIARERRYLQRRIGELRSGIREDVETRWPEAGYGYTLNFLNFLQRELQAAQAYILAHRDYPDLVTAQQRYHEMGAERLEADRGMRRLDRIQWLLEQGDILDQFEHHASTGERAAYDRLLACENTHL